MPTLIPIPDVLLQPTSCLIGYAGTGKSFLAKAWAEQDPSVVLAATTGIASTNLGSGTTLNALLGYFDTASLVDSYTSGKLQARLGRLWRSGIRRLVVDEVSMMDAEQLTVITRAAMELDERKYFLDQQLADELDQSTDRFPIQLTLVGDFAQLPPVKAPFAFTSPEWPRYAAALHKLTEIRRQTDGDFIHALHAARRGDPDPVCAFFGPRLVATADQAYDGTTLVATNDAVDRINRLRMDKLAGTVSTSTARRWATQRGDWKNVPDALTLKIGALVMLLANRRVDPEDPLSPLEYANGDLGHVVEIDGGGDVWVKLVRTGLEVAVDRVTRNNTIPLEPGRAKALKAAGEDWKVLRDTKQEIIGTVNYLPIRAAWASTVHKAQGLSFDTVQISTHEGMFRQFGLLYVALSRARTAEGLRLCGTLDGLRARVTVDPQIAAWL